MREVLEKVKQGEISVEEAEHYFRKAPFDAADYYDPEDFYYDHYDDFFDYEEAEDYFYEHN